MDPALLEKEVLAIYDIRQIQKYIFSTHSRIEIVGAGRLVTDIISESFEDSIKKMEGEYSADQFVLDFSSSTADVPYFHNPRIMMQVIYIGGGNALVLYRTGKICQEISRKVSRYFLDHSYTLDISMCAVEKTDNIAADISRMYENLMGVKASMQTNRPLCALPIVEVEENTGYPAVDQDVQTGAYLSQETMLKRGKARLCLKEITALDRIFGGDGMVAVMHIDGNNMGSTIGRIMRPVTDYEEGIKHRRAVNASIQKGYLDSLNEATEWLQKKLEKRGIPKEDFINHLAVLGVGGDDINVVCTAKYALSFVEQFVSCLSRKTIWENDELGSIPFSVCAGVVFIERHNPYYIGIQLAEEVCHNSKVRAKAPENLIDGAVGNWVDFHICQGSIRTDLEFFRERTYNPEASTTLLLRPYCMDAGVDTPFSFSHFKNAYAFFNSQHISKTAVDMLDHAYSVSREETLRLINMLQILGFAIPENIGEPFLYQEEDDMYHARWYDALELKDLFEDLTEDDE